MRDAPSVHDVVRRLPIDGTPIGAAQEEAEEQDDGPVEDKMA